MSHIGNDAVVDAMIDAREQEVKSDQDMERDIEQDRAREFIADVTSDELSSCCGAPIIMETFCSDCKEGCK